MSVWKFFAQTIGFALISFILLLTVNSIYELSQERYGFQLQRVKCNQAVFNVGPLSEQKNETFIFGGTTTAEMVEQDLKETNKEVNRLRSLLGCYFDR